VSGVAGRVDRLTADSAALIAALVAIFIAPCWTLSIRIHVMAACSPDREERWDTGHGHARTATVMQREIVLLGQLLIPSCHGDRARARARSSRAPCGQMGNLRRLPAVVPSSSNHARIAVTSFSMLSPSSPTGV
jgi:hypothetical protein